VPRSIGAPVAAGVEGEAGDLFCGDLMDSMGKPSLEFFIDDLPAAEAIHQRLRRPQSARSTRSRQAVPAATGRG
jgi:hypothetical protein